MTGFPEEFAERLLLAARAARANAHAPYSGFSVGAALLDEDGAIHVGCNVENASFGLSVCAERNAVAAAVAAGGRGIVALVVLTPASPPASPCGACRQVLAEFGDFPVLLVNSEGERRMTGVAELLPSAFDRNALDRS